MRATTKRAIRTDPNVLLAVVEYRRQGLDRHAIRARLRMSERTYYRCLEELDRRRAAALESARRD